MIKHGHCSDLQEPRMTENINYSLCALSQMHKNSQKPCGHRLPLQLPLISQQCHPTFHFDWLNELVPRAMRLANSVLYCSDWLGITQHLSTRLMCHQRAACITKSDSLFIYISVTQSVLSKHIIIVFPYRRGGNYVYAGMQWRYDAVRQMQR